MIIGAVVAMSREARLVRRCASSTNLASAVIVSGGGIGPVHARDNAHALVQRGATLLLSTGYAGGLATAVMAGELLVPETVLDERGVRYTTWAPARERVLGALAGSARHHSGTLLSGATVIASVDGKRAAARASGAQGVDLESAAVAAVGRECGVPVLVLRSVSDGAGRGLPRVAVASTRDDGRVSVAGLLAALATRPWELPALLRLARDVSAAERTLEWVLCKALPLLVAMQDPAGEAP